MLRSFTSRSNIVRIVVLMLVLALFNTASAAQSYLYATGAPTFSTNQPVESGFVNVANGNLHLEIPLAGPAQRGSLQVSERLVYDSRIWQPVNGVWSPTSVPNSLLGWRFLSGMESGAVTHSTTRQRCGIAPDYGFYNEYTNFLWTAPDGTQHLFPIDTATDSGEVCESGIPNDTEMAADSSGYKMVVTNYTQATVYAPDGSQVYPTWEDTNGNSFLADGNGNLVDTLGRTPVAYSTNGTNQNYYDVLGSDGQTHRVIVTYSPQTATSAFSQYTNQSVSQNAITQVDLPDGSHYYFGYDSWGELNSITLPTGAQITYNYTTFNDAYSNQNRWVYTKSNGSGTWTFSPAVVANSTCQAIQTSGTIQGCQQVTFTKPSGDYILYTFTMNGGAWNSEADFYNNGGTRLATTTQLFDLSNPCPQCGGSGYIRALTATTQLPTVGGQLTKQTQYSYDSAVNGNITAIKEWNFTTGSLGPTPDRETDISYLNGSQYTSANILNRPQSRTTYTGACCANRIAETDYSYDSTGLTSTTGITHHDDTNYGTGNTTRGNLTQTRQWISGSAFWTTTLTYDTTGQVVQAQDNKGNSTSFDYSDHFYNDNGSNPPNPITPPNGPTNAYVTTVNLPITGTQTMNHYFGSGKVAFSADQNGATSYAHFLDPLDRRTQSTDPIGGWKLVAYPSATQQDLYSTLTSATSSTGCTSCRHDQVVLDSLGRVSNTPLVNDPDGQINAGTSYDSNSRVSGATNPYRSTSDNTYGSTSFSYDGLDRVLQITRPDNNTVLNTYGAALGSATSVCGVTALPSVTTDETGNKRQYWNDGFGQLVEVDEPDSGNAFSIATCYQYDALNNLKTSTQRGGDSNSANWRVRSYAYDGLSRVTQVTTPEAGTVNYSFTSGGSPCSGDASLPCSRTDARNITTTYSYDALDRLTAKTYSDTTPAVSYFYDQTSYNGLTIAYGKGRRTGMSDGTGQTAWTYDAAGNVLTKRQTIAGVTNSISYSYNLNGSVATLTTPNGHVYTYGYGNALRAVSLVDNGNGYTYVQNTHYAAPGLLTSAAHGLNLGITESNSFNNRLQPTVLSATGVQTVLSLSYNWTLPNGKNNGSVYQIQNNRDTTRSLQYTYDQLNRLATAGTYSATTWGNSYLYDNWGNLLQKNQTQGTAENLQVTVDAHNHIDTSGFTYDAAGNLVWDGFNAVNFDAENRVNPDTGYVYSYDGDDHRVEKNYAGSITYYWYDDNFNVIATTGALVRDYVYFNDRRVAYYSLGSGNQHYYWQDHLGSASVMSNSSGDTIEWEADYYPFGTERVLNNYLENHFLFTGYEFDYEMGYYYADYREQSPNLGRFFSPDPILGDATNPQSLNRYAYVLNNPTNLRDPFGLCDVNYYDPITQSYQCMDFTNGPGGAGGNGRKGPVYAQPRRTPPPPNVAASKDNWLRNFGRAFVNGVLQGVRQPGQSFTQCVLQNANTTTGGAHGLLLAGVISSSLSEQAFNYRPGGPDTVSLAFSIYLSAQEISPALGTIVGRTLAYGSAAAPYLAAAEGGLLVGSAINCR